MKMISNEENEKKYNIKTINTLSELKKVFNFISLVFYNDACENNEHYYTMGERYDEMRKMLEKGKEFLMYVEEDNKIIAALTGKNLNDKKITMGVLAVDPKYRRKGIAKLLICEFENRCLNKGINHIDLGSRFRACSLYLSMDYKPLLMI